MPGSSFPLVYARAIRAITSGPRSDLDATRAQVPGGGGIDRPAYKNGVSWGPRNRDHETIEISNMDFVRDCKCDYHLHLNPCDPQESRKTKTQSKRLPCASEAHSKPVVLGTSLDNFDLSAASPNLGHINQTFPAADNSGAPQVKPPELVIRRKYGDARKSPCRTCRDRRIKVIDITTRF
jgi:hypothetical protein